MRVIAIDIDGTALEYPDKVRGLFDHPDNVIILYTARNPIIREQTELELREKDIPYHALVMGKLRADIYVDDKNQGGLQWPNQ
jgi:hypothetical protein